MASLRKRGRVWYYRYSNADGVKHEVKGCSDRRVTEELARSAESEAAKIKAGVIDLKELAYLAQGARPLAEHLEELESGTERVRGTHPERVKGSHLLLENGRSGQGRQLGF